MKSLSLHLKILILLFLGIGLGTLYYEYKVLEIPIQENEEAELWTIDAKLSYEASPKKGVTLHFFQPDSFENFEVYEDNLVSSKEFGRVIEQDDTGNRIAHYSIRQAEKAQTIFYHLVLASKLGANDTVSAFNQKIGKFYREKIKLEDAEKVATEALISTIRSRSSDTKTFISEAIEQLNKENNDQVKILFDGKQTPSKRYKVLETLLSQAHIPIQRVNALELKADQNVKPEIWVRSFINSTQNDKWPNQEDTDKQKIGTGSWVYFNAETGEIGFPSNYIIWSIGEEPIFSASNANKTSVEFSIDDKALSAISLANAMSSDKGGYLANSLYSLPNSLHHNYEIMMMIPFGVLVVLLVRNIIGFQTLGTFTPVLIALAFRETGLAYGIGLFTVIVALGLLLRAYLEHLKLQMLSRLSVVLTFVVILISSLSILSYKLGLDNALAINLFPMVILTMTIERLSITWEERGGVDSLIIGLGTLVAATLAFLLMGYRPLVYFVFTFPGVLFVLIAFMLLMGRYRGYRLLELVRFKALANEAFIEEEKERVNQVAKDKFIASKKK